MLREHIEVFYYQQIRFYLLLLWLNLDTNHLKYMLIKFLVNRLGFFYYFFGQYSTERLSVSAVRSIQDYSGSVNILRLLPLVHKQHVPCTTL